MESYRTNDALATEIAHKAYPNYTGRTIRVEPMPDDNSFEFQGNYWSGGSKSYYVVLSLSTFKTLELAQQNPLADARAPKTVVPNGYAVIEHTIFCGKDHGITIHVPRAHFAKLLPDPTKLSWSEQVVLVATRGFKNTYGGRTNMRFHEAHEIVGISEEEYNAAKMKLFNRGFLKPHGKSYMITNAGRNAIQFKQLYDLRTGRGSDD